MQTPVRDFYINMLEKRASGEANPDQWSTSSNDQQIANAELDANVKDQRAQLKPMFETAAAVEKADTKLVGKLLPKARASSDSASSNPFLKVASQQAFFDGLRQTGLLKMASPDYIKAAYVGFERELNKISAWVGAGKGALTNALNAARKKPAVMKSLVGKGSTTISGLPAMAK